MEFTALEACGWINRSSFCCRLSSVFYTRAVGYFASYPNVIPSKLELHEQELIMSQLIETDAQHMAEVVPRLMSAFHNLQRRHENTETLTMRQFQALVLLSVRGSMMVTELCERLNLAPSTGSELIQRMIGQGYIKKIQEKNDRREVAVSLTELGTEMFRKRKQELVSMFQKLLESFTDKDRRRLLKSFDTIFEIMSKLSMSRSWASVRSGSSSCLQATAPQRQTFKPFLFYSQTRPDDGIVFQMQNKQKLDLADSAKQKAINEVVENNKENLNAD
jgi:DNA-binding MarR family transcriptional regulator